MKLHLLFAILLLPPCAHAQAKKPMGCIVVSIGGGSTKFDYVVDAASTKVKECGVTIPKAVFQKDKANVDKARKEMTLMYMHRGMDEKTAAKAGLQVTACAYVDASVKRGTDPEWDVSAPISVGKLVIYSKALCCVTITSNPPNATVEVDNTDCGQTEAVSFLTPGTAHKVKVTFNGKVKMQTVRPPNGEPMTVPFDFTK